MLYILSVRKRRKRQIIHAVEKAILERLPICESFEPYHSKKEREYTYYRTYVKNFIIFYVVIPEGDKKVMEVRRFLYKRQDRDSII